MLWMTREDPSSETERLALAECFAALEEQTVCAAKARQGHKQKEDKRRLLLET